MNILTLAKPTLSFLLVYKEKIQFAISMFLTKVDNILVDLDGKSFVRFSKQ